MTVLVTEFMFVYSKYSIAIDGQKFGFIYNRILAVLSLSQYKRIRHLNFNENDYSHYSIITYSIIGNF